MSRIHEFCFTPVKTQKKTFWTVRLAIILSLSKCKMWADFVTIEVKKESHELKF